MKRKKRNYVADAAAYSERKLTVTKRFWGYIGFLAFVLVFTQILQSKATHLLLWFALLMPFALLAYILTAFGALRAYVVSGPATLEKLEEYTYELKLINEYIIPYPFAEAIVTLPQADSVRCRDRVMKFSMLPHASYVIKHGVKFRYRGAYELGIRCIYAYDLFRIFRVRIDINSTVDVTVTPRRCHIDDSNTDAVSDSADRTLRSPYTFDKLEVSDIRNYRPGDGLKSVHWKLSSKSEELVVKDYNTGVSKMTYIFCDMSARYPDEEPDEVTEFRKKAQKEHEAEEKEKEELKSSRRRKKLIKQNKKAVGSDAAKSDKADSSVDPQYDLWDEHRKDQMSAERPIKRREDTLLAYTDNKTNKYSETADSFTAQILKRSEYYEDMNEYCADGVVELTVAAVMRELRLGNFCCLVWFDKRAVEGAFGYILESYEDLEMVFQRFVTAPLAGKEDHVTMLSGMLADNQIIKRIFVTASLDPNAVKSFCSDAVFADANSYGSTEILFFEPFVRFALPTERRIYIGNCKEELAASGVRLTEYRSDDKGLHRV